MKNIILFIGLVTIGLLSNSCSDHSAETVNTLPDNLTLTVNGVERKFTDVSIVESTYTNEDQNIPSYNVLATHEEDNGEFVAFQIRRDYTGNDGLYEFIYTTPAGSHTVSGNFTFSITQNSGNRITGTFSGPLFDNSDAVTPSVTVTEGSFDINL